MGGIPTIKNGWFMTLHIIAIPTLDLIYYRLAFKSNESKTRNGEGLLDGNIFLERSYVKQPCPAYQADFTRVLLIQSVKIWEGHRTNPW